MNEVLDLRAGELVEVRGEAEILATLDSRGALDSLPFMPEMLPFCGKQFRVSKRADKACDTIDWGTLRRMENAVHLDGLRCNGSSHGGCQASCLFYWKEAWLKRVADASTSAAKSGDRVDFQRAESSGAAGTVETLDRATRRETVSGQDVFSCQATELVRATSSTIPWWRPGQYVQDVRSGNARVTGVLRGLFIGFVNKLQKANRRFFPRFTLVHGGATYPFILGRLTGKTPAGDLNLGPGDLVEVKSRDEIFATLNERDQTRGLRFDGEMLKYCGRRGKVLHRIERIIDEKTGAMHPINTDCIIIEGFYCTGDYHRSCPRGVYTWWRESWLKRVE